jgi:hypothetical protein
VRHREGCRACVVGQIDVLEVREVAGPHVAEAVGVEAARLAALRVGEIGWAARRGQRHGGLLLQDSRHQWPCVFPPGAAVLLQGNASRGTQISRGSLFGADGALRGYQGRYIVGLGDDVEAIVGVRMNIVDVRVKRWPSAECVVLLRCEERCRHLDGRRNFGKAIWLSP